MDSLPEYDVHPNRDKHGVFIGGWVWEVYDAVTQGPIDGGIEGTERRAHLTGMSMRAHYERKLYG